MSAETVSASVTVKNKLGLHIRPSRQVAGVVAAWDAEVTVRNQERSAAGDSQLDLLMLLASKGTELEITARGPQAQQAIDALVELIEGGFGEED